MKILSKIISVLLLITILAGCLAACGGEGVGDNGGGGTVTPPSDDPGEFVDYVATVKLDRASGRLTSEATVKAFIDGDTTHFYVDESVSETGVLKARYLAINTPESTGQVEPWGKAASNFTKEKLSAATSIIIESDDGRWNLDSTGDRHLVWVWYKTAEMQDYRNLNLEIMQEGLAIASSYMDYAYGTVCRDILSQAVAHKLHVHDKNTPDPNFYYGSAQPITLKELKTNVEKYKDTKVSFEGVVVRNNDKTAYIEEYDDETGLYFGIQVYYGFNLDVFGEEILTVGNRVRIVGKLQYYEEGGIYQVSDIYYYPMDEENEANIQKLGDGFVGSYAPVSADKLQNGKETIQVTVVDEDGNETIDYKTFDYGFIALHGSASLENLTIKSLYTTTNPASSSKGAITITCVDENGVEVTLRTIVLKDAVGNLITESRFPVGSVINAKGIVDYYDGIYQLKIFSISDITFVKKA